MCSPPSVWKRAWVTDIEGYTAVCSPPSGWRRAWVVDIEGRILPGWEVCSLGVDTEMCGDSCIK